MSVAGDSFSLTHARCELAALGDDVWPLVHLSWALAGWKALGTPLSIKRFLNLVGLQDGPRTNRSLCMQGWRRLPAPGRRPYIPITPISPERSAPRNQLTSCQKVYHCSSQRFPGIGTVRNTGDGQDDLGVPVTKRYVKVLTRANQGNATVHLNQVYVRWGLYWNHRSIIFHLFAC